MGYYSVTEVSEMLGVRPQAISRKLKAIGHPKSGGIYIIDEKTLDHLKSRKGKRGRPKGVKNKPKEVCLRA